jgi:antitoxin component YwqK of YwqJK toxin-antitoxin module
MSKGITLHVEGEIFPETGRPCWKHHYKEDLRYVDDSDSLTLHREDGPAVLNWYENGNVMREHYCIEGKLHREDGPAQRYYYEDGSIKWEAWCVNGQIHRLDGPAFILYREDRSVEKEEYFVNDKFHRIDGPARIWYKEDESIMKVEFWLEDEECGIWEVYEISTLDTQKVLLKVWLQYHV